MSHVYVILGDSKVSTFNEIITGLASEQIDGSHVIFCFTHLPFSDNWIVTLSRAFSDTSACFIIGILFTLVAIPYIANQLDAL
uniref:Uncharacterized protein n=1 Tax=Arundo donax TaxID=35708 RepID=A0A0A9DIA2_ARUDO